MSETLPRKTLPEVIGLATLIVGTLDIAETLLFYNRRGVPPILIPQSIASGVLGDSAFRRGLHSAALGLALHYFITFLVVTFYLLANRRLPLTRHPYITGVFYGIVVYIVMNYVVTPLSLHYPPQQPFAWAPFLNSLAASIFLIGLPIAFLTRRYQWHRTQNP